MYHLQAISSHLIFIIIECNLSSLLPNQCFKRPQIIIRIIGRPEIEFLFFFLSDSKCVGPLIIRVAGLRPILRRYALGEDQNKMRMNSLWQSKPGWRNYMEIQYQGQHGFQPWLSGTMKQGTSWWFPCKRIINIVVLIYLNSIHYKSGILTIPLRHKVVQELSMVTWMQYAVHAAMH